MGVSYFRWAVSAKLHDEDIWEQNEIDRALLALDRFREAIECLRYLKMLYSEKHTTLVEWYLGDKGIKKLSGRDFECFIGALFKEMRYYVKPTQAAWDRGADMFIKKADEVSVVQVKRWCCQNVSTDAIETVLAAKKKYKKEENCTSCIVVTNRRFSTNAIELANKKGVKLIDGDELKSMLIKLYRRYNYS